MQGAVHLHQKGVSAKMVAVSLRDLYGIEPHGHVEDSSRVVGYRYKCSKRIQ